VGATAIYEGCYGDQVFDNYADSWALAEYIWRRGFGVGAIRLANDICLRAGTSMWRLLREGIRDGWAHPPRGAFTRFHLQRSRIGRAKTDPRLKVERLLTEEVWARGAGLIERFNHPWLRNVDGIPPGKLLMVATLTAEMRYNAVFSRLEDAATIVGPLGSQPLVELCLRIATYLSRRAGWRRAVARQAFRSDLPEAITFRTSKGSYNRWVHESIMQNLPFVRESLLDGVLVQERILDRKRVEQALARPEVASGPIEMEIIRHLYTECWLRHWVSQPYRAAA
jgi:asparagine synthase (glutamine-hydrolysing)